jgi:hypothetical protein
MKGTATMHRSNIIALSAMAVVLAVIGWKTYQEVTSPPVSPPAASKPAQQGMTDARAEQLCREQVQASLAFPSSFDLKLGSTATAPKTDGSGDRLVQFSYSAKSGAGIVLAQSATCVVKADGRVTATTANR